MPVKIRNTNPGDRAQMIKAIISKRATIKIPFFKKRELAVLTAWAEAAVYEELTDIITLTGNVRVTTKKGEEFRAPEVVISVEEEWMKARDVSGITFRRRDENE